MKITWMDIWINEWWSKWKNDPNLEFSDLTDFQHTQTHVQAGGGMTPSQVYIQRNWKQEPDTYRIPDASLFPIAKS
jgi:hypothetical protein